MARRVNSRNRVRRSSLAALPGAMVYLPGIVVERKQGETRCVSPCVGEEETSHHISEEPVFRNGDSEVGGGLGHGRARNFSEDISPLSRIRTASAWRHTQETSHHTEGSMRTKGQSPNQALKPSCPAPPQASTRPYPHPYCFPFCASVQRRLKCWSRDTCQSTTG